MPDYVRYLNIRRLWKYVLWPYIYHTSSCLYYRWISICLPLSLHLHVNSVPQHYGICNPHCVTCWQYIKQCSWRVVLLTRARGLWYLDSVMHKRHNLIGLANIYVINITIPCASDFNFRRTLIKWNTLICTSPLHSTEWPRINRLCGDMGRAGASLCLSKGSGRSRVRTPAVAQ
jgi:hypothetical protein